MQHAKVARGLAASAVADAAKDYVSHHVHFKNPYAKGALAREKKKSFLPTETCEIEIGVKESYDADTE